MAIDAGVESGRTLVLDGLVQNDLDMQNFRLLNLDTSNLPPIGIPPSFVSPPHYWIDEWDAVTQEWHASRPEFGDIAGRLTTLQMASIIEVGTVRAGRWEASVIDGTRLTTLDLIRAPIGNVSMAGKRLVNLASPVDANDAVTLGFMDYLLQGLQAKEAVRCASTTRITPATLDRPVDGVDLSTGDRVLVKDQGSLAESDNGIYIASTGPWDRAEDSDDAAGLNRAYCTVIEGTQNAGTSWVQVSDDIDDPLGSEDTIRYILFSSTPSANSIVAGTGMVRSINTLNVQGTDGRISVSADNVDIDSGYEGQDSIITVGNITTGTWNGDVIDGARGGTGVSNVGHLITLIGNLTIANIFDLPAPTVDLRFILSDDTNVTLPTVGKLATLTGVERFQNKDIVRRVSKVATSTKPAINVDDVDVFCVTALSNDIVSMTDNLTGTAQDRQQLEIWIKEASAVGLGKAITWGTSWLGSPDMPLPVLTIPGVYLFMSFTYVTEFGKWLLTATVNNYA